MMCTLVQKVSIVEQSFASPRFSMFYLSWTEMGIRWVALVFPRASDCVCTCSKLFILKKQLVRNQVFMTALVWTWCLMSQVPCAGGLVLSMTMWSKNAHIWIESILLKGTVSPESLQPVVQMEPLSALCSLSFVTAIAAFWRRKKVLTRAEPMLASYLWSSKMKTFFFFIGHLFVKVIKSKLARYLFRLTQRERQFSKTRKCQRWQWDPWLPYGVDSNGWQTSIHMSSGQILGVIWLHLTHDLAFPLNDGYCFASIAL